MSEEFERQGLTLSVHFLGGVCLIKVSINPLTPRSDQYVNSPYNFNTLLSRQVMRIKKIINQEILFGYNIKFS